MEERGREREREREEAPAIINPAAVKQKAADYCIDEFNDRASAFIVAQSFTRLISRSLFRAPSAAGCTAE